MLSEKSLIRRRKIGLMSMGSYSYGLRNDRGFFEEGTDGLRKSNTQVTVSLD